MSLQECYDRDQANCTRIDNSCVLEYNPDGENPTCVPAMANMFPVALGDRPKLSDSDLRTIQRVLMRLLPPGNAVHGANALDQAIQGLFVHLRPRVDWKISKQLSGENYSSWLDVVLNISQDLATHLGSFFPSVSGIADLCSILQLISQHILFNFTTHLTTNLVVLIAPVFLHLRAEELEIPYSFLSTAPDT